MSQPPSSPYPGSYPPPQQQPGGWSPPQQPQYGDSYPPAPQQPQYGGYPPAAPQYGGQQYGGPEGGLPGFGTPVAPPKKSRAGRTLLIILAVVVVLCLGGGVALYALTKDTVTEVVGATKTRVSAPETLAGRPKVTDPRLQSAALQMSAEIKKEVPEATSTVGAFYGNPDKRDLVMIAGASGLIADPKKEMADAAKSLSTVLGVSDFATVEAGPLGGDARCGDGKTAGTPVGVCVWADRGSLGLIVIYYKSAAELQKQFVTMRGEIEQKG